MKKQQQTFLKKLSSWIQKDRRIYHSDLLALPFLFAILLIATTAAITFYFAGPIGVAALFALILLVTLRILFEANTKKGFVSHGDSYLLVVANEELRSPVLQQEVLRRQSETKREVALVVPVRGKTFLSRLADDIDDLVRESEERVLRFHRFLADNDIQAYTKIDLESDAFLAAVDGIREKPVGEALLKHSHDSAWEEIEKISHALKEENIPVTVIGDAVIIEEQSSERP